ncbi:MAG: hypothetical protein KDD64_08870 [Bdellovibrionales bacterium]|nr:hypothetical protein [Bdellovibrionales bacterium]
MNRIIQLFSLLLFGIGIVQLPQAIAEDSSIAQISTKYFCDLSDQSNPVVLQLKNAEQVPVTFKKAKSVATKRVKKLSGQLQNARNSGAAKKKVKRLQKRLKQARSEKTAIKSCEGGSLDTPAPTGKEPLTWGMSSASMTSVGGEGGITGGRCDLVYEPASSITSTNQSCFPRPKFSRKDRGLSSCVGGIVECQFNNIFLRSFIVITVTTTPPNSSPLEQVIAAEYESISDEFISSLTELTCGRDIGPECSVAKDLALAIESPDSRVDILVEIFESEEMIILKEALSGTFSNGTKPHS